MTGYVLQDWRHIDMLRDSAYLFAMYISLAAFAWIFTASMLATDSLFYWGATVLAVLAVISLTGCVLVGLPGEE